MLSQREFPSPGVTRFALLTGVIILFLVALLFVPTLLSSVNERRSMAQPVTTAAGLTVLGTISDGQTVSLKVAGVSIKVKDTITPGLASGGARSYTILFSSSRSVPTSGLAIHTFPVSQLGYPLQLPGGLDALPPFTQWTWSVVSNGHTDTKNWSATPSWSMLKRNAPLVTTSFTITGHFAAQQVTVTVPSQPAGYYGPQFGVVLNTLSGGANNLIPSNDTDYASLGSSIHVSVARISLVDANTGASWSSTLKAPKFNFQTLDGALKSASAMGSSVLLTLPVGTWGDGNLLPNGMPVNTSYPMFTKFGIGYFPMPAAYSSYVRTIVNHVSSIGASVEYWAIGNEVPLNNSSVITKLIQLFNTAEGVIHSTYPSAKLGTDSMMNRTYLPTFARWARNVGFLSFHYYPAVGQCIANNAYCAPQGGMMGTQNPVMWMPYADMMHRSYYPPLVAQQMWYNATHSWIPVLSTETNMNAIGGTTTAWMGTDPRLQTVFGATWLVNMLMDGWSQNLSAITYFTLSTIGAVQPSPSSPYGGWGFGMTSEGTHDNDTLYAPYWAAWLWGRTVQPDQPGQPGVSSNPYAVRSYAVSTPGGLSVLLLNRVAMTVKVKIQVNGTGLQPRWVNTLDKQTYQQTFAPLTQSTSVVKSGVYKATLPTNRTAKAVIHGYGVSVVHFAWKLPVHHSRMAPLATATSVSSTVGPTATPAPSMGSTPSFLSQSSAMIFVTAKAPSGPADIQVVPALGGATLFSVRRADASQ